MEKLTREQWNEAYAARMMERAGLTKEDALGIADCADESFIDDDDPADSADEELSCWGD